MIIKIKAKSEELIPQYMSAHASGMDLKADLEKEIILKPLERMLVPTGIHIEVPVGYEAQVRPRSGLAIKHGVTLVNTPGTIDADYRGEVKVIMINLGSEPYTIKPLERIAQLVISKVEQAKLEITTELSDTKRSSGGFGHTGV